MEFLKHHETKYLNHVISAPFIYAVFIWFIILDIFVEIYHRICFPLYWIPLIDRKKYIRFDRHKLPYLSLLQKFNCFYCSYWNWLINYVREIAWVTEKYWCGIRHMEYDDFIHPEHHKDFIPYWDEETFYKKYWHYKDECKLTLKRD